GGGGLGGQLERDLARLFRRCVDRQLELAAVDAHRGHQRGDKGRGARHSSHFPCPPWADGIPRARFYSLRGGYWKVFFSQLLRNTDSCEGGGTWNFGTKPFCRLKSV